MKTGKNTIVRRKPAKVIRMSFRVSAAEAEQLGHLARASGFEISDYIRARLFRGSRCRKAATAPTSENNQSQRLVMWVAQRLQGKGFDLSSALNEGEARECWSEISQICRTLEEFVHGRVRFSPEDSGE